MSLLKKQVTHKAFGKGVILEKSDNIITVEFSEAIGAKKFPYPEIFESFMTIEGAKSKIAVANDITIKSEKLKEEKALKEKEKIEAALEKERALAEEKAEAKKKAAAEKKAATKANTGKAKSAASQ